LKAVSQALGPGRVTWTGRGQGHLGLARAGMAEDEPARLEARRRAVVDLPWSWLHQVHGREVVSVEGPGRASGAHDADAMVTATRGLALAVLTADCAPIAMASAEGVIGIAHTGWRGLLAGVIASTAQAMRRLGSGEITAVLGPCIRAGCYEFGPADLDVVAAALGDGVRSMTAWGTPALDLAAGVRSAAEAAGVTIEGDLGACTACSDTWFSHRARGDQARQATVIWMPAC
jgi:YfiH family protein